MSMNTLLLWLHLNFQYAIASETNSIYELNIHLLRDQLIDMMFYIRIGNIEIRLRCHNLTIALLRRANGA